MMTPSSRTFTLLVLAPSPFVRTRPRPFVSAASNTLLSVAVLTALPRLRVSLRRVLWPALFVAAGLELLKSLGRLYVQRTETNAAYLVVAGAVGLLVSSTPSTS